MRDDAIKTIREAEANADKMFRTAGDMIELMKRVRSNALAKRRAYHRLAAAVEANDKTSVRAIRSELSELNRVKIIL